MTYDRKIKVKCCKCKKIYTRYSNKFLDHKIDGTECNCINLPFVILEEIKS